jgi:hypothetical protein
MTMIARRREGYEPPQEPKRRRGREGWFGPEGRMEHVRTERRWWGRVQALVWRDTCKVAEYTMRSVDGRKTVEQHHVYGWVPAGASAWTHRGAGEKVAALLIARNEERADRIVEARREVRGTAGEVTWGGVAPRGASLSEAPFKTTPEKLAAAAQYEEELRRGDGAA